MKASVIIPTYNRCKILHKALLALAQSTFPAAEFEVIVVDDGSTDGTAAMVRELDVPYEIIFQWQERGGPARARNRGIELARGDIAIFIDSDIIVVPDFVAAHVKAHKEPRVVANGPVIHTDNLDNPAAARKKLTDVSRAFFATGNTSVEKRYLLEAGLFDEAFQEYGWEDLELGHRLKKLGLRAVKVPEAVGYHYKERLKLASLPYHRRRERERGHMAVLFHERDPGLKTRLQLEMTPLVFGLDRLLSLGNWMEWKITRRFLEFLEARDWHLFLRVVVRLITHHDYMEGMREALRQRRQERAAKRGNC